MQIVIPCGGLATRLGRVTKDIPKSLVKINNKPFITHQIDLLKKYDVDEILLLISHFGNQIKHFLGNKTDGILIKYCKDPLLDVIGALKNAERMLQSHFIMMYGDSYLPFLNFDDMYHTFLQQPKLAMMAVWRNNNRIDKSNIKIENNKVICVEDKDSDYIDYGATVLNKRALDWVPQNKKFSTKQLWKLLVQKNELVAYKLTKRFYHVGNLKALQETKTLLNKMHH